MGALVVVGGYFAVVWGVGGGVGGVVGAGGLGQLLAFHMGLFQMGKTATILGAMLLMVVLVDALSYLWRRALMR